MSPRSSEEAAVLARFAQQYRYAQRRVMLDIERNVCGCDYGGTSWTTQDEADRTGKLLGLGAGKRLLDLGAGSGWPGLYLARSTGCDVTLVDIPLEGLRIAAQRIAADRLPGDAWILVADGGGLPFQDGSFDAIGHSDVLCCLEAKASVLAECRRVVRAAGTMAFSVISIAPALSSADRQRAVAAGPPFKVVSSDYPAMLADTRWTMLRHLDVTPAYSIAVRRRLAAEEANAEALIEILGEAQLADTLVRRRRTAEAIGDGLLRRELIAAIAAA